MRGTGETELAPIAGWRWWWCVPIKGVGVLVTYYTPRGNFYQNFFPHNNFET